jgi:hypothetical protein
MKLWAPLADSTDRRVLQRTRRAAAVQHDATLIIE